MVPQTASSSAPFATDSGHGSAITPTTDTTVSQQQYASVPVDESRTASVTFNGITQELTSNIRGEFPRLIVPASATITASIPFVDGEIGELIPVQAEDGGQLKDTAALGSVPVDADHKVNITYQVSANDGMHRVTLRRGGENRVLEFWVGAEPPVIVRK